jgi:predicted DNA binding protein
MENLKKAIELTNNAIENVKNETDEFELIEHLQALEALEFIIDSNGGLTDKQIEALQELIDGGYIEAINDYELKIHN